MKKLALLNNGKSLIEDKEIYEFLDRKSLNFVATTNKGFPYTDAYFVIITTPTD